MRMVCGAMPVRHPAAGAVRRLAAQRVGDGRSGSAIALSMTGLIRSMLVSVTPTDPLTFVAITLLFVAVVMRLDDDPGAAGVARRPGRCDPKQLNAEDLVIW